MHLIPNGTAHYTKIHTPNCFEWNVTAMLGSIQPLPYPTIPDFIGLNRALYILSMHGEAVIPFPRPGAATVRRSVSAMNAMRPHNAASNSESDWAGEWGTTVGLVDYLHSCTWFKRKCVLISLKTWKILRSSSFALCLCWLSWVMTEDSKLVFVSRTATAAFLFWRLLICSAMLRIRKI